MIRFYKYHCLTQSTLRILHMIVNINLKVTIHKRFCHHITISYKISFQRVYYKSGQLLCLKWYTNQGILKNKAWECILQYGSVRRLKITSLLITYWLLCHFCSLRTYNYIICFWCTCLGEKKTCKLLFYPKQYAYITTPTYTILTTMATAKTIATICALAFPVCRKQQNMLNRNIEHVYGLYNVSHTYTPTLLK